MPIHRRHSLGGALIWFVLSYGVAIVGYLALNALASRALGRSSFGYFVIALTATTIVGQFALLGVHRAGLREAARLEADSLTELAQLRLGVRAVCLISLPTAGVLSGVVAWAITDERDLGERLALSVAVAFMVVLSGHQKLWANYLRGFGHIKFASLMEGRSGGALVALLQGICLAGAWILLGDLTLASALVAVAIGYLVPVVAAHRLVARYWRRATIVPSLIRDLGVAVRRDWRFASGQLASYLNSNLELWLAGLLLSAVDTSLFGAAQRLSLVILTPLTSLQVVFSPAIARLSAARDPRLEMLLRTGATIAAVPMMVLCIPILAAPGPVMRGLFGEGYGAGAAVLLLLMVGAVVNVITGPCGATLSMTHREGISAVVQWCGFAARLVLGVAAAKVFGLEGLAAAAALVTSGVYIALWLMTRRKVGVRTDLTLRPRLHLLRNTAG